MLIDSPLGESPAPRQGVAGDGVSPRARSEQRERGRGPAENVRQRVVTPPLSDIFPAGHIVVPPKLVLQHGGVVPRSPTLVRIPWYRLKSCLSMGSIPRSTTLVRTGSQCVCRRRRTTPPSVV